jgi:hypothetical protein
LLAAAAAVQMEAAWLALAPAAAALGAARRLEQARQPGAVLLQQFPLLLLVLVLGQEEARAGLALAQGLVAAVAVAVVAVAVVAVAVAVVVAGALG